MSPATAPLTEKLLDGLIAAEAGELEQLAAVIRGFAANTKRSTPQARLRIAHRLAAIVEAATADGKNAAEAVCAFLRAAA